VIVRDGGKVVMPPSPRSDFLINAAIAASILTWLFTHDIVLFPINAVETGDS
jgi:hypothetical protein